MMRVGQVLVGDHGWRLFSVCGLIRANRLTIPCGSDEQSACCGLDGGSERPGIELVGFASRFSSTCLLDNHIPHAIGGFLGLERKVESLRCRLAEST